MTHELRFGADAPVQLIILPALFEEANRMRRFTAQLMRALALRGIGTTLPELPGMGESPTELADVALDDWRDAVPQGALTVAIRGGALLDGAARAGWRLSPESGERVVRDLLRATALSSGVSASALDKAARERPTALAGNVLSPALYSALHIASPSGGNRRTARLADEAGVRDASLTGSRLWRAAEPGEDDALVAAAADDIAVWTKTCASL